MAIQTLAIAVVTVAYFVIRYLNRTDVPKIKGLPEIPGIPLFGNLLQLGNQHAVVAGKWAKEFGPVFQVRMGNRVFAILHHWKCQRLTRNSGLSLPTASTRYASSGLRINLRSFRGRPSILFTAWCPALKGSPLAPRLGMSLASVAERLQLPR